jgi:hypothetical protein
MNGRGSCSSSRSSSNRAAISVRRRAHTAVVLSEVRLYQGKYDLPARVIRKLADISRSGDEVAVAVHASWADPATAASNSSVSPVAPVGADDVGRYCRCRLRRSVDGAGAWPASRSPGPRRDDRPSKPPSGGRRVSRRARSRNGLRKPERRPPRTSRRRSRSFRRRGRSHRIDVQSHVASAVVVGGCAQRAAQFAKAAYTSPLTPLWVELQSMNSINPPPLVDEHQIVVDTERREHEIPVGGSVFCHFV